MVVLITGTSTGLGLETAILFAEKGYNVYATMRDVSKSELLKNKADEKNLKINILELDVCKVESIENAVKTVFEKEGKIDILINNAGAGFAKTTEHATDEELNWVTETNYLSVVRCTKAVLPIMRAQKSGHIINISSVGGLVGQPFNELYCAAKFAVEGFTEALATYLPKYFGIKLTAIEPGGISTEFNNSASKKTLGAGLPEDEYLEILHHYISGIQKRAAQGETSSYQTPEEVAKVILEVAETENPPIRKRTSAWAEKLCEFKTDKDPDGTLQNQKIVNQFLGDH